MRKERSRDYIGTPVLYIPTFIGLRTDISFLLNLNIRLLIVGFSLTENRVMVDHQLSPENVNTIRYYKHMWVFVEIGLNSGIPYSALASTSNG